MEEEEEELKKEEEEKKEKEALVGLSPVSLTGSFSATSLSTLLVFPPVSPNTVCWCTEGNLGLQLNHSAFTLIP